jgi:hypothetical protein
MLGAAEDPHVRAQLGHDDGRHDAADPGNLLQQLTLRLVGRQGLVDVRIQHGEIGVDLIQAPPLQAQ